MNRCILGLRATYQPLGTPWRAFPTISSILQDIETDGPNTQCSDDRDSSVPSLAANLKFT